MRKILVPVDGSDNSLGGVRHAIRLGAESGGAEIHLVNVQPQLNRHIARFAGKRAIDAARRDRGHEALAAARRLVDASGLTCRSTVLTGTPAPAITAFAAGHSMDQIVLGAPRRSPLLQALTASVSAGVAARATVPVVVVNGSDPGRMQRYAVPAVGLGIAALLLAAE